MLRRGGLRVLLLLAVSALAWGTFSLLSGGARGAEIANVLALPAGVVGLLFSLLSWQGGNKRNPEPEITQLAAETLALRVRKDRERFLSQALGRHAAAADLLYRDPELNGFSTEAGRMLLSWQTVNGPGSGDMSGVAAFFDLQPSNRMVILGRPGAGKSVLASKLCLDLCGPDGALAEPNDKTRVPVWLSLVDCDLTVAELEVEPRVLIARFDSWLSRSISEAYDLPEKVVNILIKEDRLVLFLDGLDEMDSLRQRDVIFKRPRAATVLEVLNADGSRPVVLTSRLQDYQDLAPDQNSRHDYSPVLEMARHVALLDLSNDEITSYIRTSFPSESPRWDPIIEALDENGEIRALLNTPWRLYLLAATYQDPDSSPSDLLHLNTTDAAARILNELIPAVVRRSATARARNWRSIDVSAWLRTLAALHFLPIAPRMNILPDVGALAVSTVADLFTRFANCFPFVLAGGIVYAIGGSWPTQVLGLSVAAWGANVAVVSDGHKITLRTRRVASWWRSPRARREFGLRLRIALGFLAVPILITFVLVLIPEADTVRQWILVVGMPVVAVAFFFVVREEARESDTRVVVSARKLIRQSFVGAALDAAILGALTSALAAASRVGNGALDWRHFTSLASLLTLCFFTIDGGISLASYALNVRMLASRGRLPFRTALFMDWCVDVGLLRLSGGSVELRHRQLQEYLLSGGGADRPEAG